MAFLLAIFFCVISMTSVFALASHDCAACKDNSATCLDLAYLEGNLRQLAEANGDSGGLLVPVAPPAMLFAINYTTGNTPTLVWLNARMNN